MKKMLLIGGLDPSGGAGLVADIQCCSLRGVHSYALCTMLTSQSFSSFVGYEVVECLWSQWCELRREVMPDVVKVGMLAPGQVAVVIDIIADVKKLNTNMKLVVDPVLSVSQGAGFVADVAELSSLLAKSYVATPNSSELMQLGGTDGLLAAGCSHVLETGGKGSKNVLSRLVNGDIISDTFYYESSSGEFHGSGCTLSAFVGAELALGMDVVSACASATDLTGKAVASSIKMSDMKLPNRLK